jgi:hypothetical protein
MGDVRRCLRRLPVTRAWLCAWLCLTAAAIGACFAPVYVDGV